MKKSTLFALFVIGITYCATAQTGGGGAGASGSSGAAAPATTPTAPATTQPGQRTVPNPIQRNQVSPGVSMGMTNQFGMNTNMQGTNNLSPTGATSGTNQMRNHFPRRDHAETDNDRQLLIALRQNLLTQLGITSSEATPINFNINNGVVILIGFLPTADQCQHVAFMAQQTPGVSQVVNQLQVGTPPATPNQPLMPATINPALTGATTDHAFSPSDRQLLFKVQRQASTQLGSTPANGLQSPVHFSIQNGIVAVTGQLSTQAQKQRLMAAVQNIPGVIRVVDDVTVSATTPRATVNPSLNNRPAPTPTGP